MSISNLIKISLLSLVFLSKTSFAVKINGEEVMFPEGMSDGYIVKSYQSASADAWIFNINDDEITLSPVKIDNIPHLIQASKQAFDEIDVGKMQPSYVSKNLKFTAQNINFEKTLAIAKEDLNFNAGVKINIEDSIMDVGGQATLNALQMNFKNLTFRTKHSVILENQLEEGSENWLKAIEVFSHDIENTSFLRLDGIINFDEPSIPEKFMVFGANKISIAINKL